MNTKKLDKLRAQYAEGGVFDNHTERFQAIAHKIAGDDTGGTRTKPYSGISTFLDAPPQDAFTNLDVALIGVPMDLAVSNRAGARLGPRAVRSIERIGPMNHQSDVVLFQQPPYL